MYLAVFKAEMRYGTIKTNYYLCNEQGCHNSRPNEDIMNNKKQTHSFPGTAGLAVLTFLTAVSVSCLANGRGARASLSDSISDSSKAQTEKRKAKKVRFLTFSSTVHNFGEITNEDGPQTCVFKYSNQTDTTILINDIKTTCECTKAEWSRKPIRPGESGEIKVTYANEGAPHHFDKGAQVYTSTMERPILLRIQGTVVEKKD